MENGKKMYVTAEEAAEMLTYNDIDLEKCTISVNKSYQRIEGRDIITPPKTPKSKRIITIPPFLAEKLKEHTSHLYGIMADERMFRFTKSYMEHEIIRGIKASGVKVRREAGYGRRTDRGYCGKRNCIPFGRRWMLLSGFKAAGGNTL